MDQGSLKQELVQPRLSGIGVKEYPASKHWDCNCRNRARRGAHRGANARSTPKKVKTMTWRLEMFPFTSPLQVNYTSPGNINRSSTNDKGQEASWPMSVSTACVLQNDPRIKRPWRIPKRYHRNSNFLQLWTGWWRWEARCVLRPQPMGTPTLATAGWIPTGLLCCWISLNLWKASRHNESRLTFRRCSSRPAVNSLHRCWHTKDKIQCSACN